MTTTLEIKNKANSNGDVHMRGVNVCGVWHGKFPLHPGESAEVTVTDSTTLHLFETWPSTQPADVHIGYGEQADAIIAREVAGQDKMWGVANERADSSSGQLLKAALAQGLALADKRNGDSEAFAKVPAIYPAEWSGFRDYGSDVANLAVAAAFIRQEIKRLLANGASTYRAPRPATQPYGADQPAQPFPTTEG
jgi:hypothetical protein